MKSQDYLPAITWLESANSTNSFLLESSDLENLPNFTAVATTNQTAGRGRHGRNWTAPNGSSLALSILLRPNLPTEKLSLLPLVAGLSVKRTLSEMFKESEVIFALKWPNDILAAKNASEFRKLCGILCELNLNAGVVICGIGINLTLQEDDLPVPTATSLKILGLDAESTTPENLASKIHAAVAQAVTELEQGKLTVTDIAQQTFTIGREVSAELPNGEFVNGKAAGLTEIGEIIINTSKGPRAIAAALVTHLR